jgi:hypothetical protein
MERMWKKVVTAYFEVIYYIYLKRLTRGMKYLSEDGWSLGPELVCSFSFFPTVFVDKASFFNTFMSI